MVTTLTEKGVFKDNSDIAKALNNRALLFKEVNRGYKDPIDRSVFKQSIEDKNKLYSMKTAWKKAMQECYPNSLVRKTFNNPLCK